MEPSDPEYLAEPTHLTGGLPVGELPAAEPVLPRSGERAVNRDPSRWAEPVFEYASLEAFKARTATRSGITSIRASGGIFDVLVWDRGADLTVISFNASLPEKEITLPAFVARRVVGEKVNAIFFSDPALYLDRNLRIGWFAGFDGCDVPGIVNVIIGELLGALNGTRTIFLGYSAGGFAALGAAWHFPQSLTIAVNPQTRIEAFTPHHVERYARAAFDVGPDESPIDVLCRNTRHDLLALYGQKVPGPVLYLQNAADKHVDLHERPFLDGLPPEQARRVRVVHGHWGEGHWPPPPASMAKLFRKLGESAGGWGKAMKSDLGWMTERVQAGTGWW